MSVWGVAVAAVGVAVSATMGGIQAGQAAEASKDARAAQAADANARVAEEQRARSDEASEAGAAMAAAMIAPQNTGADMQYLQLMGYDQSGGQPGETAEPPDPSTPRQRTLV